MKRFSRLQTRRDTVLKQIAALEPMRKGSLTAQFVPARRKDGTAVRRGPYPLYTCKKNGRTVSRRLSASQADTYRHQIAQFRSFQALVTEFVEASERLADEEVAPHRGPKKNSRT